MRAERAGGESEGSSCRPGQGGTARAEADDPAWRLAPKKKKVKNPEITKQTDRFPLVLIGSRAGEIFLSLPFKSESCDLRCKLQDFEAGALRGGKKAPRVPRCEAELCARDLPATTRGRFLGAWCWRGRAPAAPGAAFGCLEGAEGGGRAPFATDPCCWLTKLPGEIFCLLRRCPQNPPLLLSPRGDAWRGRCGSR